MKKMKMKSIVVCAAMAGSAFAFADTLIVSDDPSVVRNAAVREAIRQDSTWTSENIAKCRVESKTRKFVESKTRTRPPDS